MTKDSNSKVFVSNVEPATKRRLLAPLRRLRTVPRWAKLLGIFIVVVVLGVTGYLLFKPDAPAPPDEQAIVNEQIAQSQADFEAREALLKNAPTPQQTYDALQKQATELKDPNNSQASLQTYIEAAFAGAEVKNPESRTYAAKALQLYPTDPDVRAMNAGQITRLEAIAKGDYAAATE